MDHYWALLDFLLVAFWFYLLFIFSWVVLVSFERYLFSVGFYVILAGC
jgi:hypothetical protein